MIERTPWRRRFFTIWIGQQLSVVGSRAAQFALVWWVTDTTGSATVLATAAMVALVPQILLGPFVGALIDRWNRRAVMAVSDAFIALLSLGLVLLFWSGRIALWHVYAIMLLRSIGETFHWPAMAASTTLMVPKRHLARIGGLNQTVLGILSILAPPLGALLMALLPLHAVMLVDVGTAAFAVIPLLILTIPQPAREHVDAVRRTPFLASAREGLRFVFSWPGLVVLIASASIVKIALQPAFSLLPLLVRNHFGGGAAELSLFQAIAGGGILLGGLILGVWGGFRRRIITILMGVAGVGVSMTILGFTPPNWFWLGLSSIFVAGAMISMIDGPLMAILQATVPAQIQGRVFALLGSLFSLTTPLGLALAGPVSDLVGVTFWFRLSGILCVVMMGACAFIPALTHIEDQKRAGSVETGPGLVPDASGEPSLSSAAD